MTVLLRRAVEVDATVARQGSSSPSWTAAIAVGGQRLTLQGLGGVYDDIFLPLHGRAPGRPTPRWRWPPSRRSSAPGPGASSTWPRCRTRFAGVASPGRLERVRAALADDPRRRRPQSARCAGVGGDLGRGVRLHPAGRRARRDGRQGRRRHPRRVERRRSTRSSSPSTHRRGPCPWSTSRDRAVDIFGEDRVHSAPRMDDAIALAVDLAEDDPEAAGGGHRRDR